MEAAPRGSAPMVRGRFGFPGSRGVTVQPTEERRREPQDVTREIPTVLSRPEPSTARMIRLVRASRLAGTEKIVLSTSSRSPGIPTNGGTGLTKRGSDVPFATSEEAYALSRNDSVSISKPVHGSDGPALPRDE